MPQRNPMWRVGCFTMMRRSGRSCRGKYTRLLIISALGELSFSCRLKMVGYAAKAFSWSYLLHIYESVVADCCVRRGRGGGCWVVPCLSCVGDVGWWRSGRW